MSCRRILVAVVAVVLLAGVSVATAQEPRWPGKLRDFDRGGGDDGTIVAVAPGGSQFLLLRQDDKPVRGEGTIDSLLLYETETGKQLRTVVQAGGAQRDQIEVAALSPGRDRVVTGNWYGWVHLRNVEDGAIVATWRESFREIDRVAFSPDGKRFATAAYDDPTRLHLIHVYDVDTKEKVATFEGHADGVSALAFLSTGRLVSGGNDERVCVWDLSTPPQPEAARVAGEGDIRHDEPGVVRLPRRAPVMALAGHTGAVRSVAVSRDGRRLLSGGMDGRVCLWDASTGKLLRKFVAHGEDAFHRTYVEQVAFLESGAQFLSSGSDPQLRLWDVETGQALAEKSGGRGPLHVLPGGERMIVGRQLWATPVGFAPKPDVIPPKDEVATLVPSTVLGPVAGALYGIVYATQGEGTIVVATNDSYVNRFVTYDLKTARQVALVEMRKQQADGTLSPLGFSPGGRLIACGGDGGNLVIIDVATGAQVKRLVGHRNVVYKAVWSPDGKTLITSESPRPTERNRADIFVWDVERGRLIRKLEGSTHLVWAMAVTPDGKRLVTGNGGHAEKGGTVECFARVWDLAGGNELFRVTGHDGVLYSAAVSPDGKLAATGQQSGPVLVWDASTGKELRRVTGARNRNGNTQIAALAFSPDSTRLATGGADSDVVIWDVATGDEVLRIEKHTKGITWMAWVDAGTLASASADGTVRVWAVDVAERAKEDGL